MRKLLLILFPISALFAQIPTYYTGIDFSQNGEALKNQLSNLVIATHSHELIYTPEVWDALKQTDLDPQNLQDVLLIYGQDNENQESRYHRTRSKDLSCHTSSCTGLWVREHVFPKSLATPPMNNEGPGSDAHAIRAIDSQMNNGRSNRRFAEGEGYSHINSQGLFYPGDEWKGDVARMMMYLHIRYVNRCNANAVGSGANTYSPEMPDIFLKWNAEDPVSEYEWVRNQVLENMQGNRNPFIDNPYLATKIWGGDAAENTWSEMNTTEIVRTKTEVYPNPTSQLLNIQSNKNIDSISIYSTDGTVIISKQKWNQKPINVSNYTNGSYFLLIYYKDSTKESQKFMVKK